MWNSHGLQAGWPGHGFDMKSWFTIYYYGSYQETVTKIITKLNMHFYPHMVTSVSLRSDSFGCCLAHILHW